MAGPFDFARDPAPRRAAPEPAGLTPAALISICCGVLGLVGAFACFPAGFLFAALGLFFAAPGKSWACFLFNLAALSVSVLCGAALVFFYCSRP